MTKDKSKSKYFKGKSGKLLGYIYINIQFPEVSIKLGQKNMGCILLFGWFTWLL